MYGDVSLQSSTVSGNDGVDDGYAVLTFENSIVAGNPRSNGGDECASVQPKSKGGNVFDPVTDCGSRAGGDDVITANPGLRTLADNGGRTPTIGLRAASPAVDLATSTASRTDQRGVRRGQEPDSGAFERKLCGGVDVNVVGTRQADDLLGTPGRDGILAGGGPDRVDGGGSNDSICGGAGRDVLKGGLGDDLIRGGRGKDRCSGGAGSDKAIGCKTERGIER